MDEDGRNELHRAVIARDLGAVTELVAVVSTDLILAKDPTGLTPLHLSCLLGDAEICQKLLQAVPTSTPISQLRNNNGRTPLHCALAKQRYALVPILLEWRAQLANATDNNGWTAVHLAASVGAPVSVLRELVESGGDVRIPDKQGCTAGVIATQDEHPEVVKYLLDLGREMKWPWWKDEVDGKCAVDYVKSEGMRRTYKEFLESI